MVKWLIAACLALTMVIVSIDNWMHGTLFGAKIHNINAPTTRRSWRRERATAAVFRGVLAKFQKLQSCCAVPSLITGTSSNTCSRNKQFILSKSRNGLFGIWQEISTVKEKTDDSTYACYTDCVFLANNLISTNSSITPALNITNISNMFMERVPVKWNATVMNAISTCDTTVKNLNLGRFVMSPTGKLCSAVPLRFMVCIRKNMILNCPKLTLSSTCRNGVTSLRKSNLMLF